MYQETLEFLNDLPARTLSRTLASILQSTRRADQLIGDGIVNLALSCKQHWTLGESTRLEQALTASQVPVREWLTKWPAEKA